MHAPRDTSAAVPPAVSAAAAAASSRGGDPGFEATFGPHRESVFRFLWRLTRNAADAEDLLQETYVAVWRKQDAFEGRGSALGYLRRTAFRLFLNEREKRKRREEIDARRGPPREEPTSPPADEPAVRAESNAYFARQLERALAELPDEPREAFLLFRFEGMTCAEIGALADTPAKTIETRVRRATELLAAKLRARREDFPS